ncbi:hypothetical protein ACGFZP_22435 [Kitasatospora sp. NPDC048239]|uniref:hypothetical protein n=1 Tax=Kitasatospora sp. NPDC048239 TaxID=3364046 RepID=UPI00371A0EBC
MSAPVRPGLVEGAPADSSGFLLQAIDYYPTVWGDGWTDHSCVSTVERENQGTDAVLHDPNAIVPYSVGRYVGQVYGGHTRPGDEPGALTVRNLNGLAPVTAGLQINPAYAASPYGRILYNTVREAEWTGTDAHAVALRAVFGRDGWICRIGGPQIRSHGFLQLPGAACGSSTHV